jgi:hypothetical protein
MNETPKGAKPADLQEQPTSSELLINLEDPKQIGNDSAQRLRADRSMIEIKSSALVSHYMLV